MAILGACGEETIAAGPSTSPPEAVGEYSSLEAPKINGPVVEAPLLRDSLIFTDCGEADRHVKGFLNASAQLATEGQQRLCYVEELDVNPGITYAGAIIIDRSWEIGDHTLFDVFDDGGVLVSIVAGAPQPESLRGSDPDAPGGGYADFALKDGTIGRVVRVAEDRTQAILEWTSADGPIRVEVTSGGSPDEVVALTRAALDGSSSKAG